MNQVSRRKFLMQTTLGLGSAMLIPKLAGARSFISVSPDFKESLGFQTFPIREMLAKDFGGTLKMMAGLGYQNVEMCSPSGYVDSGFGPLKSMSGKEVRKVIEDAGLKCPSCHFTFDEMKDNLDERIQWSKDLGLDVFICSSFWLGDHGTMKQYQDSCDLLNKMAEKISKAGMMTGYHNHEMEFALRDGVLIYDAMMQALDPKLVKMQFQTEVINLGYKASTYFEKYPGRFISAHLSDWTKERKSVPIGQGMIDWKEFFKTAKTGGVKYLYVEMAMDTFKPSAEFVHSMV